MWAGHFGRRIWGWVGTEVRRANVIEDFRVIQRVTTVTAEADSDSNRLATAPGSITDRRNSADIV